MVCMFSLASLVAPAMVCMLLETLSEALVICPRLPEACATNVLTLETASSSRAFSSSVSPLNSYMRPERSPRACLIFRMPCIKLEALSDCMVIMRMLWDRLDANWLTWALMLSISSGFMVSGSRWVRSPLASSCRMALMLCRRSTSFFLK